MKYLIIVTATLWLITLGAFLWARFIGNVYESMFDVYILFLAGTLAIISTIVLIIVALAKWFGA